MPRRSGESNRIRLENHRSEPARCANRPLDPLHEGKQVEPTPESGKGRSGALAAGSKTATHSTCDVIGKISAWASHRKAQVRAALSTLCPGCGRPERQMSVMTNRPSLLFGRKRPPQPAHLHEPAPAHSGRRLGHHDRHRFSDRHIGVTPSSPRPARTHAERRLGRSRRGPRAVPGEVPAPAAGVAGRVARPGPGGRGATAAHGLVRDDLVRPGQASPAHGPVPHCPARGSA